MTAIVRLVTCLTLCAAASAQAQNILPTTTAIVSAQVQNTCKFAVQGPQTISIGAINPSADEPVRQTSAIDFQCTRGFPISVGIADTGQGPGSPDGFSRTLVHKTDASQTMPYKLRLALPNGATGRGFGPGNGLVLSMTAELQPEHFRDASSGEYEETVVVELRP